MGFEPTSTDLRPYARNDWTIIPLVQLVLRVDFAQQVQFYPLLTVSAHSGHCLHQSPRLTSLKFSSGNHSIVAEWTDTSGSKYWGNLWSSYRKLAWGRFATTNTEFGSVPLTNWAIRPCGLLVLRAHFLQMLQLSFFSVSEFFLAIAFTTHYVRCNQNFLEVIKWV